MNCNDMKRIIERKVSLCSVYIVYCDVSVRPCSYRIVSYRIVAWYGMVWHGVAWHSIALVRSLKYDMMI